MFMSLSTDLVAAGAARHRMGSHELQHFSNPEEGFTTITPEQVELDKVYYPSLRLSRDGYLLNDCEV